MPSMRAMWTAGEALDRDNAAGFNCCYTAVDHIRAFDEAFYLLMCGCGVGFSVERQNIAKLPEVAEDFHGRILARLEGYRAGADSLIREDVSPEHLEELRALGYVE